MSFMFRRRSFAKILLSLTSIFLIPVVGAEPEPVPVVEPQIMNGPGLPRNDDFVIEVSADGKNWAGVPGFDVLVDQHQPRHATFAAFDFAGVAHVRVRPRTGKVATCEIRPLARNVVPTIDGSWVTFTLNAPAKLSVEINGDRFSNLHLFAGAVETDVPGGDEPRVIYFGPGLHTAESSPHIDRVDGGAGAFSQCVVPSDTTVYLHRDAVVQASLLVDDVRNVTIRGRGVIDATPWMVPSGRRTSGDGVQSFPGIQISKSYKVTVDGVVIKSPISYLIHGGDSSQVTIRNLKGFNHHLWGDGIDFMSCSDVHIDDVFIRASDDCIAIYGSRWLYSGDSRNWLVENSIFWADKAHPIHIGTHGSQDTAKRDVLGGLVFRNIDILEHDERHAEFFGAMSLNAGDEVIIDDVRFEAIRVETISGGELFNVRVMRNGFNPVPGYAIKNIVFSDITYSGENPAPSTVRGHDDERQVDGVRFHNIHYQGRAARSPEEFNLRTGPFTRGISVR